MNDPHLVRDLSPGDKLSLKGKIFELQRKLNLIDLETRINDEITSELPFKPTIYTSNYSPLSSNGKNDSGSSNIFKAEIIQKVYIYIYINYDFFKQIAKERIAKRDS